MDKNISIYILGYISAIGTIIPFLFGLFRFKYLKPEYKLILVIFGLGSITELASRLYATYINPSNIWIFNIYQVLETILIIGFYLNITTSRLKKRALVIFAFIFVIISISQILKNKLSVLNDLSFSIESVLVVILSILSFHSILKRQIYTNILAAPLFWINSSFLLYYSGNLFLHLFSKFLLEHALYAFFELWGVWHSLLNIGFYILISIGLWKTKTSQI